MKRYDKLDTNSAYLKKKLARKLYPDNPKIGNTSSIYSYSNADTYKSYTGYEGEQKLTKTQYLHLLKDLATLLLKFTLKHPGFDIIFPYKFFAFGPRKNYTKLQDNLSKIEPKLDMLNTIKYRKHIYYLNLHTDGAFYKWFWPKNGNCFFPGINNYIRKSSKNARRIISEFGIKNGPVKKIVQQI